MFEATAEDALESLRRHEQILLLPNCELKCMQRLCAVHPNRLLPTADSTSSAPSHQRMACLKNRDYIRDVGRHS